MIKMTLPDGSKVEVEKGISVYDFARSLSEGLARNCVGAEVDGEILGMADVLEEDGAIRLLRLKMKKGKKIFGTPVLMFLRWQ